MSIVVVSRGRERDYIELEQAYRALKERGDKTEEMTYVVYDVNGCKLGELFLSCEGIETLSDFPEKIDPQNLGQYTYRPITDVAEIPVIDAYG